MSRRLRIRQSRPTALAARVASAGQPSFVGALTIITIAYLLLL